MLAYVCWSSIGIFFFVLGIYTLKAKKPVSFWTVQQEIEVNDIKKYNCAVARLWFGFGIVMMLLGLPLFAGQNSPLVIISIIGMMFASIFLMVIYTRIEKKYRMM